MKQYVVDAFTTEVFKGNQAAVCFPKEWPSDEFMTKVAMENKFSETAFIIKEDGKYHIRWFTLSGEIDFCGHATLASAHTIKEFVEPDTDCIEFTSMHGPITVLVKDGLYEMHFPPYELRQVEVTDAMEAACGRRPVEAWMDRDLLCLFDDEEFVRTMEPDQEKLLELDGLLFHATAKGSGDFDCVSRTFAPKCNVAEDPVCGSGHCHIVPYWADKLGKKDIVAFQASERSGVLYGKITDTDMTLSGYAATFSRGEIKDENGNWE